MTAWRVGRFITGLALALAVIALMLAVAPNPDWAYNKDDVRMRVDCGALLRGGSDPSLDDFCGDSFIRRAMLTTLLFLLATLLGAIGLVLLHRGKRPQGEFVERNRPW